MSNRLAERNAISMRGLLLHDCWIQVKTSVNKVASQVSERVQSEVV